MLSNEMFRVAHDDYFWHLWQMCGKRNECMCVLCLPQMLPLHFFFFPFPALSLLRFIYKQSKSSPFNCFICQTKSILIAFSCWHFECQTRGGGKEGGATCNTADHKLVSHKTRLAKIEVEVAEKEAASKTTRKPAPNSFGSIWRVLFLQRFF